MLDEVAEELFGGFFSEDDRRGQLSNAEEQVLSECLEYVTSRFSAMKYILGTGLDFALLAQQVASQDSTLKAFQQNFTYREIETRYPRVESRGERLANTLSVSINGHDFGIRKLEEAVLRYFVRKNKPSYPSAYVYNTGQWAKYKDLLTKIFALSSRGRYQLFVRLLDFGNQKLPTVNLLVKAMPESGPFERIIREYPRTFKGENGGLALQAISYGFVASEYRHLEVVAAKVRSGSARQKRIGDIDCYRADALAVTFEVKDFDLSESNAENEIGEFVATLNQTGVLGIVICASHSEGLWAHLNCPNLRLFPLNTMAHIAGLWDEGKQQNAADCVLHFLSNIEQNGPATDRLKSFLETVTE